MGKQNKDERNKVFRLTLADNATHKSIRTVKLTKMSFIYWTLTIAIAIILAIYCLIAFTPLRTTIPGYPDAHSKKTAVANAIKIDSLESAILRWNLYATNLSRVLSGEGTADFDSLVRLGKDVRYLSSKSSEELARQDSLLREMIHKEEQFEISNAAARSLPVEGMHFFTPVKGVISAGYDNVLHPAVDISAPAGTIVSSILDGAVIHTGWDENSGYVVIVQHKDNVVSVYGNNGRVLVSTGDEVKAGTPIAIVGNNPGESGAEQLHLELWHNGKTLDPAKYISF